MAVLTCGTVVEQAMFDSFGASFGVEISVSQLGRGMFFIRQADEKHITWGRKIYQNQHKEIWRTIFVLKNFYVEWFFLSDKSAQADSP